MVAVDRWAALERSHEQLPFFALRGSLLRAIDVHACQAERVQVPGTVARHEFDDNLLDIVAPDDFLKWDEPCVVRFLVVGFRFTGNVLQMPDEIGLAAFDVCPDAQADDTDAAGFDARFFGNFTGGSGVDIFTDVQPAAGKRVLTCCRSVGQPDNQNLLASGDEGSDGNDVAGD